MQKRGAMRYAIAPVYVVIMTTHGIHAAPFDAHLWKDRLLIVSASSGTDLVEEQRRIYRTAAEGMSERQIILIEALDDSERSRILRTQVSANGKRFQVFLVGKDGHVALSSDSEDIVLTTD
jgi:hypothetical protein